MINTQETLLSTLKKAGLRITPQRMAICELLSGTDAHPTAAMIYEHIHEQYPSLSLATVYNTLDALVGLRAINMIGEAGDDSEHYDANTSSHIHLACISCHKIIDIFSPLVVELDREISQTSGYQLLGARVVYYGLCPHCQNSTKQ